MKDIPTLNFTGIKGNWILKDDISVSDISKRDIYHSPLEPSFVCWAILWKEHSGALKVSFVEATGDLSEWPPTYNFNSRDIEYYLKTLVSTDGGQTWNDTGWREDMDDLWELNPDHHIRHVFQAQDGSLLRNYCHTLEGALIETNWVEYDATKEMQDFPFTYSKKGKYHQKFYSFWKSTNGGESWNEICPPDPKTALFITATRQLSNSSIVATGALQGEWSNFNSWQPAIIESWDGGLTWSKPQVFAENDDKLAAQMMGEENDFVELEDGRLLLIQRTDGPGMHTMQFYLTRDADGTWTATPPSTNPDFVHSGYPFMMRTSDGVIFYYCHSAIRYTCDDGLTWGSLSTGYSYYGQIVEAAPGQIVAITQKNIADCGYPWKYDTSMHQTSFNYTRIKRFEQTDHTLPGCVAALEEKTGVDFHMYAEVRADGESGVAFNITDASYGFTAIVIPKNEFRSPGNAAGTDQDACLIIGKCEDGIIRPLRTIFIGKVSLGAWIEIQLDMQDGVLKTAVKPSEADWTTGGSPATYMIVKDDFGTPGSIGFFTNKSTGSFKNVKLGPGGTEIRSNWKTSTSTAKRLALDAGRQD